MQLRPCVAARIAADRTTKTPEAIVTIPASILTLALTALHFALAVGVTLHVLAHNRNPGSAVAWIGLAWLSPVVGSVLYADPGHQSRAAARPQRCVPRTAGDRRGRSRRAVRRCDTWLAWMAAPRLSGRHVTRAMPSSCCSNGDEAYPQMIAAIEARSAQRGPVELHLPRR